MRKLILKTAGWIHASLILAIITPTLYSFGTERQDAIAETLYFKCLLIFVPVALTDLAIDRCKELITYLLSSLFIFTVTAALGFAAAGSLRQNITFWGYMLLLLFETFFVIIDRLMERLHRKKAAEAAKGEDPSFRPEIHMLRQPAFVFLCYFPVIYAAALNMDNPALCNTALFSAIAYVPVLFLHRYVDKTEEYLSLNKRTCSLPSARIYGIGTGMLAMLLLLFLLTILPALFTTSHRNYHDLRKWLTTLESDYVEPVPEDNTAGQGEEDFMKALMAEYGEPKPAPYWLELLSDLIQAAVLILFAVLLLKKIRDTFRDFRGINDENGDIVEELERPVEDVKKISVPGTRRGLSERERIRRNYRKTIRRHRKERPAVHESPAEIEARAGIADSEAGRELHRTYESARYGREG